jgi:fermentation-respiration switch protein FrsA (DUF1100 family)
MSDQTLPYRSLILFKKVAIAAISAIIFWMVIIMFFENKFIFFPSPYPSGPYEDLRAIDGLTEHTFMTEDNVALHGIYSPAESARVTILFSHGNAGNLSHRIHWLRNMTPLRANIFMYDYRGYGKSEGTPAESGVYADVRAAYDYVRELTSEQQLPIVAWGRSLGGAVAVDLAVNREVDGLIVESTFTSAREIASAAYPFLPGIGHLISSSFDSGEKISAVSCPTLHIHGDEDSIVPLSLGEKLFRMAPGSKDLYIIEGAGHNDTYIVGGSAYTGRIDTFLRGLGPLLQ